MKNIKEITDIFKQEIKKKYTSQITMPIYMGVSDMEIILEEIERLNNIINELEKYINEEYVYDDNGMKIFDVSKLQDKLQELKGSDKSEL